MRVEEPQVTDEARQLIETMDQPTETAAERSVRPLRDSKALGAVPAIVFFVVVIGVWEAVSRSDMVSDLILPAPSAVAVAFGDLFSSGIVWPHLRVTVTETLLGFVIGSGGGFLLGTFAAWSVIFRRVVSPYVITFQVTPRVAMAPIFLTWFGFGMTSKVVLAATICFFPVFINTVTGLVNIDEDAMELFQSLKANRRQVFVNLSLPSALPVVFAGLKTGMTLALIGAIVAEFVGASEGLGLLIDQFNFQLATDAAFAVVLLLAIVGLILYGIVELLDRKIVFWQRLR